MGLFNSARLLENASDTVSLVVGEGCTGADYAAINFAAPCPLEAGRDGAGVNLAQQQGIHAPSTNVNVTQAVVPQYVTTPTIPTKAPQTVKPSMATGFSFEGISLSGNVENITVNQATTASASTATAAKTRPSETARGA